MNIIIEKENLAKKTGNELTKLLLKYSNKTVLLMLSGGSAFSILEHVDTKKLPYDLTLSVLDERFDTRKDINNFQTLSNSEFFKEAIQNGAQSIDTHVEDGESHKTHSKRFEDSLHAWKEKYPDGVIIATMGMGSDGHTAGILPYPDDEKTFNELFENKNTWVVSYDVGGSNEFPLRTTVTNYFLRDEINHAIIYISGESKHGILEQILEGTEKLHKYPALILHQMKDVTLLTDIEINQT